MLDLLIFEGNKLQSPWNAKSGKGELYACMNLYDLWHAIPRDRFATFDMPDLSRRAAVCCVVVSRQVVEFRRACPMCDIVGFDPWRTLSTAVTLRQGALRSSFDALDGVRRSTLIR